MAKAVAEAMEVGTLTLLQKLALIREQVDVLEKSKAGFGYKYTPLEEFLAKITVLMSKYHVSLIPKIHHDSVKIQPYSYTKQKYNRDLKEMTAETVNEIIVSFNTTYTWVNEDNPEDTIVVEWTAVASQSDPSMAFGGAMTYSFRYFLANYFQIAQTEMDVDQWRSKQREAEEAEKQAILKESKNLLDNTVREYLVLHEGDKEKVKEFMVQFAKGGDYRAVKEVKLVQKIYKEFEKTFLKEGA